MIKEFFTDMNVWKYILLILALVLFFFLLGLLFILISSIYVRVKKETIYKENESLAKKCKDEGSSLVDNVTLYSQYVNTLGINKAYKCSNTVVANASNDVVKYLIKYSKIEHTDHCLAMIDFCINWRNRLNAFKSDMSTLREEIKDKLPLFVHLFVPAEKLPYKICDIPYSISEIKNPVFVFYYVSPSGQSHNEYPIKVNVELLTAVRAELYAKINKSGHSKTQRNAMTNDLREAIKLRDNYTCCICGNSVYNEPNLLLEVDHIIPISKGGKTEASNLQTLCWRCNRNKADK